MATSESKPNYREMSPVEVDTILVEAMWQESKAQGLIDAYMKNIESNDDKVQQFSKPELIASDPDYWNRTIDRYREQATSSREAIAELEPMLAGQQVVIADCEAEYRRRGYWARYYLTQNSNGHLHSSTRCNTLYETTVLAFIPSVSDFTTEQIWEAAGSDACEICFPGNPYFQKKPTVRLELPEKQRLREEREAAKAEREAKKNSKAIANPDGTVLKLTGRFGDKIRTEAEAQRILVSNLTDTLAVEAGLYQIHNKEMLVEREADNALLLTALAHKRGVSVEEVLVEMTKKAQAKFKREWK
jgi:hypothetical protein